MGGIVIPRTSLSTLIRRNFSRPQISSRSFAAAKPQSPFVDGEGWGTTDPSIFCRDFIRTNDYESYLISQFWPKELQRSYNAVKAFSVRRDTLSQLKLSSIGLRRWTWL